MYLVFNIETVAENSFAAPGEGLRFWYEKLFHHKCQPATIVVSLIFHLRSEDFETINFQKLLFVAVFTETQSSIFGNLFYY